jgi:hypothetical protein
MAMVLGAAIPAVTENDENDGRGEKGTDVDND